MAYVSPNLQGYRGISRTLHPMTILHMRTATIALGLSLSACTTGPVYVAPVPMDNQPPFALEAPADRVWDAVIDLFGANNLSIRTIERASGIIAGDPWFLGGGHTALQWADCGLYLKVPVEAQNMQLNVLVRGDSTGALLSVNPRFTATVGSPPYAQTANCVSRGVFERYVRDYVLERVKLNQPPGRP